MCVKRKESLVQTDCMCLVPPGFLGIDLMCTEVKSLGLFFFISRAPFPAVYCLQYVRVSACLYLQGLLEFSLVLGIAAGPAVGGGLQEVCMSVDSMCSQVTTVGTQKSTFSM